MKFGIEAVDWKFIDEILIEPLKKRGARLWIFGSRARGDHKPFSDLDILYEMPKDVILPVGFLPSVIEILEESTLPIKIDIVEKSNLAASYIKSVETDKQAL